MLTLTVILHVSSGSLAATRKGHYRIRHFGTTFTSWCKIFFACGGQHMNFLSWLDPGSDSRRAESQLASELGDLPLLGPRRAARVARARAVATVAAATVAVWMAMATTVAVARVAVARVARDA